MKKRLWYLPDQDGHQLRQKPSIPGIEGFLPKRYDAIYPANPLTITEGSLEGSKWSDAFSVFVFTGGDVDSIIKDLDTRYNASLEKKRELPAQQILWPIQALTHRSFRVNYPPKNKR
ncbi:hypothetical protein ACFTAO_35420 [Paenibacillus rhizoplanae]